MSHSLLAYLWNCSKAVSQIKTNGVDIGESPILTKALYATKMAESQGKDTDRKSGGPSGNGKYKSTGRKVLGKIEMMCNTQFFYTEFLHGIPTREHPHTGLL
jgi:hypothetical protein